jgi:hypothetical protein
MDEIEHIKTWAATMKLDDDTAVELVHNGFTSMESISLLTLEDIKAFKITLGQQKMLMRGVEKTFVQEKTTESANVGDIDNTEGINMGTETRSDHHPISSETTNDPYIRDIMEQLKKHQQNNTPGPSGKTQQGILGINDILSWQDPQLCLKTVPLLDSKHLDIVDFVSSSSIMSQSASENLISSSEGGQLVFKSGPLKPKLESVTLCQWSMANISIMYKLLETGALNLEKKNYYMSYTKRIYQLVTCYDMTSVFIL